ncbi:MAG: hypothetical protein AAFR87_35165, partial [Bacteroidota bacterium]
MGIQLNAQLKEPGTYFGELSIWTDGTETVHSLKVILKSDSSKGFTLIQPATSRNTNGIIVSNSKLNFSVENDSRFTQNLQLPTIKNMVKVIAEDEDIDPKYKGISFKGTDGEKLPKEGFKLAPGESKRILMEVDGLTASGKYTGTLRLSSELGSTVKETTFTLLVKHSWVMASLMILLGVIASTYLKTYLSKVRPQLEVNKGIGKVEESLKELKTNYKGDVRTQKIISVMSAELDGAKEAAENGQSAEVKSSLNSLKRKISLLPEWKQGADLAQSEDFPKYLPEEASANLAKVEETLLKDKPTTEEFNAASRSLASVEKTLNRLGEQIPFLKRLEKVEDSYEKAKDVKGINIDKLETLNSETLSDLKEHIKQMKLTSAREKLEKAEAEIQILVMEPMIKDSRAKLEEKYQEVSSGDTKVKNEERPEALVFIKDLQVKLRKIEKAITIGNLEEAQQMMEAVSEGMDKVDRMGVDAKERGGLEMDELSANTARGNLILGKLAAPVGIERTFEKIILKPGNYNPESIDRRIRTNDTIVSIIISVVALIFGLSLLWANDQTWGSGMDYMTALLWGLGLHQVGSGGIFGGLGSIQNQLISGGALINNAGQSDPPVSE